jgi:alkanesulfonate monooxygenase SsuD/methylene tetrahydromethanopterin reductase-like flavin-dependent oxidoreductase (luciferase family)
MSQVRFGIFDHMDDGGVPLQRQFAERLRLIEAYDRLGFYAYHVAEHHGTPLGFAPSPGVFLAAAAARTERLRLGPLVYSLPLYHPIRLLEEICMLDQLSGGRFDLGVGRGVSPIEVGFYGVDPTAGPRQFPEALRLIKQGLTSDTLTFHGEFYDFDAVPMVLKPVQQPLEHAHMVTLVPTVATKTVIERYASEWAGLGRPVDAMPLRGVMRLVVVARTEAEARRTIERAYRSWLGHMRFLWDQHDVPFPLGLPPEVEPMLESGSAYAGTAAGFRDFIAEQVRDIGANYIGCDVAFGDLTFDEALRTTELIGAEVIPHF